MMVTAKICDGRCRSRALDYEAEIARLRESLRQLQDARLSDAIRLREKVRREGTADQGDSGWLRALSDYQALAEVERSFLAPEPENAERRARLERDIDAARLARSILAEQEGRVQAVVEEFRQRTRQYAAASIEGMYPDTALAEALRANDPSLLAG